MSNNRQKEMFNRSATLFREQSERFGTRRQASKYLNHYGRVWKEEHAIPMTDPKRVTI
jgi:uncharacterized membrane protein YbaN (DUF454 family)